MFGAVVIWYLAGGVIASMVALEVRERRKRRRGGQRATIGPLLWLAFAAAAIIFTLWPWVALNLAQNVSL